MRIQPFDPDQHLDAVVALSLRAWAPVFVSLKREFLPEVYKAFYPESWEVSQAASVKATCLDDAVKTWVAVEDGAVAGFLAARLHAGDHMGEIYMIATDPDFQRRGVARELTRVALDWMKSQGMVIAMVETGGDPGHAPARKAYEDSGFREARVARYFKAL